MILSSIVLLAAKGFLARSAVKLICGTAGSVEQKGSELIVDKVFGNGNGKVELSDLWDTFFSFFPLF